MSEFLIKNVNFNGANLMAAQDKNEVVWVGIRWVCLGIGLTTGQMQRQITNIRKDQFMLEGVADLQLPTQGGEQKVMCIKLDYLPLWLASIPITPTMKLETPDTVKNLMEYKLKAKDVLATAFFGTRNLVPLETKESLHTVQLQFPNYTEQFNSLNNSIENLTLMVTKLLEGNPLPAEEKKEEKVIRRESKESYIDWKERMLSLADKLIQGTNNYKERKNVLVELYSYMRKNYGIVWEQEDRDYQRTYGSKASKLYLVYSNDVYRSIFETVLTDKVNNEICISLKDIIQPLIVKEKDSSPHGVSVYRRVYKQMAEKHGVDWASLIKENPKSTKKILVQTNKGLQDQFRLSVGELVRG